MIEGQDGCGALKVDACAEKLDYRHSKHKGQAVL